MAGYKKCTKTVILRYMTNFNLSKILYSDRVWDKCRPLLLCSICHHLQTVDLTHLQSRQVMLEDKLTRIVKVWQHVVIADSGAFLCPLVGEGTGDLIGQISGGAIAQHFCHLFSQDQDFFVLILKLPWEFVQLTPHFILQLLESIRVHITLMIIGFVTKEALDIKRKKQKQSLSHVVVQSLSTSDTGVSYTWTDKWYFCKNKHSGNIARGTTDPGYWLRISSYLAVWEFSPNNPWTAFLLLFFVSLQMKTFTFHMCSISLPLVLQTVLGKYLISRKERNKID